MLSVFWRSDVGSIHIYNSYISLMFAPLSSYNGLLCLLSPFWIKVYFVWYKYGYTYFVLIIICLECHLPPLQFEAVSLKLKWDSQRQHTIGSCYSIHAVTVSLSICDSNLLHLGRLLTHEFLLLPFYLLFLVASYSVVSFSISICLPF